MIKGVLDKMSFHLRMIFDLVYLVPSFIFIGFFILGSKVINVGSDTFGNFSKGLTKLAIILDYRRLQMFCLALQPSQKIGPDLPF